MPQALHLPAQESFWEFQKILKSREITYANVIFVFGPLSLVSPIILETPHQLRSQFSFAFNSDSPSRMLPYLQQVAREYLVVCRPCSLALK